MVWTTWLLLACKAEYLGIVVPKKGKEALSVDDIQRDVWLGSRTPSDRRWYQRRMKQMGLEMRASSPGTCFGGAQQQTLSVLYRESPDGYVALAAQISLAKIAFGTKKPISFCVYDIEVDNTDWFLGNLQGHDVIFHNNEITTSPNPSPVQTIADIDYIRVRENISVIAERFSLF